MEYLTELNDIFRNTINYKSINNDKIRVRDYKNGISLQHAIYYSFLYSKLGATKEAVVSKINSTNNTSFTRQAFDSKNNMNPS